MASTNPQASLTSEHSRARLFVLRPLISCVVSRLLNIDRERDKIRSAASISAACNPDLRAREIRLGPPFSICSMQCVLPDTEQILTTSYA